MEFIRYEIHENDADRRIDRILRRVLPGLPLSAIYRLIRKGGVRLNGARVQPGTLCPDGSVLEIDRRQAGMHTKDSRDAAAPPENPDNRTAEAEKRFAERILLETKDLFFLNKPAGTAVHGADSLCAYIPHYMQAESLSFRSGALHRLDKNTTGILAFSRTLEGARWFSRNIQEKTIGKFYAGILESRGKTLTEGTWLDAPPAAAANRQSPGGAAKGMETDVIPVAASRNRILALFRIHTGRKHQIRRQAAARGFPLAGDTRYGGSPQEGGYFLHAVRMVFPEQRPEGLPEVLSAPFPERFIREADRLFGKNILADLFCTPYTENR